MRVASYMHIDTLKYMIIMRIYMMPYATRNSKKALLVMLAAIIVLFAAILVFPRITAAYNSYSRETPKAEKGVLNLSNWDFNEDGKVMLGGEWAFYWEELTKNAGENEPDIYAKVPDVWNNYEIGGKKLPAFGYATYSLCVKGAGNQQIALKIPTCSTAFELYIDGKLLAQNGKTSPTQAGSAPEYEPQSKTFTPNGEQFTITLLVSNYVYARGGAWYAPILGTPSQIDELNRFTSYRDWFLIGSFVTMALFCFCIYCLAKKKKSLILFTLLALITALRTTIYGSYLLASLGLPFRALIIVEYITLIWMPVLIALFMMSLIWNESKLKKIAAAVSVCAGIITIFVIIAPVHIFTQYTIPIEFFGIGIALYSLYRMLRSRYPSKIVIAVGTIALIVCGINDVLYQNCVVVGFTELSPIGFFIMLNTWAIVLAKDYTNLTEDARISREKAQTAEIAYLQAQIKPHFLYNALNVISTLCRLDPGYAEELTLDLSKYLHYTFEFKNLSKFISFSSELEFIETYVKIEKARFVNEFEVVYDLCDTSQLTVPPLSIQPLVENAIRHGIRKKEQFGTVTLRVREENNRYLIEILDDGAGIEPEKLEKLRRGDREENDGVGLINVKQRIESIYKTNFVISSEVGVGTAIAFNIPKNNTKKK